jgi:DNA (cytosine-5)-methyltransferase 1
VSGTAISLFTGAGGLDLGLEAAGFVHVKSVESDADARDTLRRNRPGWPLAEENDVFDFLESISLKSLGLKRGELDILVGGPPCQPFSKAGQWQDAGRAGLQDPRSSCIDAMAAIANKLLPRVVLLENVPGFLQGERSGLSRFVDALNAGPLHGRASYQISHIVLKAEDYGVPQLRKRAFVVAVRSAKAIGWPEVLSPVQRRSAGDALFGVESAEIPVQTGRWGDLLSSIPAGSNYLHHTAEGGGEPLFGVRTRFWSFLLKLHPALPSWTISASPGPSTGPFHWSNRPLSIEEMARLQTFPLDWTFSGGRASRVRQIGNATPPLLAEHVVRSVATLLGMKVDPAVHFALPRAKRLPDLPPLEPVPEKYLALRGNHDRHPGHGRGPRPRRRS